MDISVMGVEISRECLVLTPKEAVTDGLVEIRTPDLRRVKAIKP